MVLSERIRLAKYGIELENAGKLNPFEKYKSDLPVQKPKSKEKK